MSHTKDFKEGFMFALIVLDSMGHRAGLDAVAAQLASVAKGELSLVPTPEEITRNIEQEHRKPLPQELKDSVHSYMSHRAENDAENSASADFLLRAMGFPGWQ